MKKFIALMVMAIALVGCDTSVKLCEGNGYTGMVLSHYELGDDRCSDGVVTPNGDGYITARGDVPIKEYTYVTIQQDKGQ